MSCRRGCFNPLIVGAYSVTWSVALEKFGRLRFQSPDCRGVFRRGKLTASRPWHGFNPLIVGAYSVTTSSGNVPAMVAAFQSPDCRGVFRHRLKSWATIQARSTGFNPLIVGAYSVTTWVRRATGCRKSQYLFQSPDCRGVFRHVRATSPRLHPWPECFNPLIVGAYSVTGRDGRSWATAISGVCFNPLIVGAYSVTSPPPGDRVPSRAAFQSPDCRGVFRHGESPCRHLRERPFRFNPLIVGAYSVTRMAVDTPGPPRCRRFNPLIVGAYSVTWSISAIGRSFETSQVSIP